MLVSNCTPHVTAVASQTKKSFFFSWRSTANNSCRSFTASNKDSAFRTLEESMGFHGEVYLMVKLMIEDVKNKESWFHSEEIYDKPWFAKWQKIKTQPKLNWLNRHGRMLRDVHRILHASLRFSRKWNCTHLFCCVFMVGPFISWDVYIIGAVTYTIISLTIAVSFSKLHVSLVSLFVALKPWDSLISIGSNNLPTMWNWRNPTNFSMLCQCFVIS